VTRLLLIGPPGAGKGTQGTRLSEELGVEHIAVGDLLRAEVSRGTPLGRRVEECLSSGELVSDELIADVLKPALVEANERGGFILDGFPRTLEQAEIADELGRRRGVPLDAVVYLDVAESELRRRLLARAEVEGRSDDTAEVIDRRLELFAEATEPLIDLYEQRGILVKADGARPVDDVSREILERIPDVRAS
jgi:adenylate kinase